MMIMDELLVDFLPINSCKCALYRVCICVRVHVPCKHHTHKYQPHVYQFLHTLTTQYTWQVPRMVKKLCLSAHGHLPTTTLHVRYHTLYIASKFTIKVYIYVYLNPLECHKLVCSFRKAAEANRLQKFLPFHEITQP